MLSKIFSSSVIGIDAFTIDVEVDIQNGLTPSFSIVGLPDTSIRESRNRIRAAIKNSGFPFPPKIITVNLAPADVKKEGASFDLPIAIGILQALGHIDPQRSDHYTIAGQLGLNGELKPIKGSLPIAMNSPNENIILPKANAKEAATVSSKKIYGLRNLREVVALLNGTKKFPSQKENIEQLFKTHSSYKIDLHDVKGQEHVKRGLEIAASGSHNILLIGPPGSGKSMLAKRLPTILSEMSFDEALQTTKIHSIAGLLPENKGLIAKRPFRAPHHTISYSALVGGGTSPTPGEISLSHNGVLFLDELPEFNRNVLEVLRQPLEDGHITISRVERSLKFPCQFMLVAAMNPCPCGFFTDPQKECQCSVHQIQRYLSKISGPLLDRIDIHIEVPRLSYENLSQKREGETSLEIRQRVQATRKKQILRFKSKNILFNAHLKSKDIDAFCQLEKNAEQLLKKVILEMGLSARAYDKILKVSRTIADVENHETIHAEDIAEAVSYRYLDKSLWE